MIHLNSCSWGNFLVSLELSEVPVSPLPFAPASWCTVALVWRRRAPDSPFSQGRLCVVGDWFSQGL